MCNVSKIFVICLQIFYLLYIRYSCHPSLKYKLQTTNYKMFQNLISKDNIVFVAIFVFIALFAIVNAFRPSIIYNRDLSFRRFGIGYKNKSVLPIWLFSIVLAILVYVVVMYIYDYKSSPTYQFAASYINPLGVVFLSAPSLLFLAWSDAICSATSGVKPHGWLIIQL